MGILLKTQPYPFVVMVGILFTSSSLCQSRSPPSEPFYKVVGALGELSAHTKPPKTQVYASERYNGQQDPTN